MSTGHRFLDPIVDLSRVFSGARQRHEVVIPLVCQVSADLQGGHLTVPNVEQPLASELLPDATDKWQIQGIVGTVSRDDIAGDHLGCWLSNGSHEFELWQIWAMILAVAILHKSIRSGNMIAVRGSGIEADDVRRYFIDLTSGLPEFGFEFIP